MKNIVKEYKQPVPEIQGFMSPDELNWLFNKAQQMNSIIEIGSWKGRSTHALLEGCNNGIVYAVDHFQGNFDEVYNPSVDWDSQGGDGRPHREIFDVNIEKIFRENLQNYSNLIVHPICSKEASLKFQNKSVDMLFIDGGHGYDEVLDDLISWVPKVTKLVCGHDYGGHVKTAVDYFFKYYKINNPIGTIWEVNLCLDN